MKLQNFLSSEGYLRAVPNGIFGPATKASLQKFQTTYKISSTGTAGPLTRTAIRSISCTTNVQPPSTVTPPTETNTVPSQTPAAQPFFTAPRTAESITIGKTYRIAWDGSSNLDKSLILETKDGVTQGYVTYYLGTTNTHDWEAGKISKSGGDEDVFAPPGDYRIRIQSRTFGKSNSDPVSGIFSLGAPEISVNGILPASIPNDGKTAGVAYGSGFVKGTSIYLNGGRENALDILYISPDGKVIVYRAPTTIAPSIYTMVFKNKYGTVSPGGSTLVITN
jgi:peptidoglycan hydrolase-like protein with peptidoglycan-binding domain